jgi:hypothetical protein
MARVSDLISPAEGEAEDAELGLVQRVEDVALVLAGVEGAQQPVRGAARAGDDPGVVAGRQAVGAEQPGPLDQVAELDVAVALQAGVRGAARGVLVDEPVDDGAAELGLHVERVEGDADPGAGQAGVVHRRDAAAGICPAVLVVRREEAEVDADDAVALLPHQEGGDGAVDAAAHGDDAGLAGAVPRADLLLGQEVGAAAASGRAGDGSWGRSRVGGMAVAVPDGG